MHGCDGKIYTRKQILNVPYLFICDQVNKRFLTKLNGHINLSWEYSDIPFNMFEFGNNKVFPIAISIGYLLAFLSCPLYVLLLGVDPETYKSNPLGYIYVLLMIVAWIVGFGGNIILYNRYVARRTHELEDNGKLYLGLLTSITKNLTRTKVKNGYTAIAHYRLKYVFKVDNVFIYKYHDVKGKRRQLETALNLPPGTPVVVLYSKEHGMRLL